MLATKLSEMSVRALVAQLRSRSPTIPVFQVGAVCLLASQLPTPAAAWGAALGGTAVLVWNRQDGWEQCAEAAQFGVTRLAIAERDAPDFERVQRAADGAAATERHNAETERAYANERKRDRARRRAEAESKMDSARRDDADRMD